MNALLCGLAGGLATIAISELLLRAAPPRSVTGAFTVLFVGLGLRVVWVLGLLGVVWITRWVDPPPFTGALLGGYLAAQVVEGLRYQKLIWTR